MNEKLATRVTLVTPRTLQGLKPTEFRQSHEPQWAQSLAAAPPESRGILKSALVKRSDSYLIGRNATRFVDIPDIEPYANFSSGSTLTNVPTKSVRNLSFLGSGNDFTAEKPCYDDGFKVTVRVSVPYDAIWEEDLFRQDGDEGDPQMITERPLTRYWLGPNTEYHAGCFCLPLSLVCLMVSMFFGIFGASNIYHAAQSGNTIDWNDTGDLIIGLFKIGVCCGGLSGALLRWETGIHCLNIGYQVFLVATLINLQLKWFEWGMAMSGNSSVKDNGDLYVPSPTDKLFMTLYTLEEVIVVILSPLFVMGPIQSMRMILISKGTGWEMKNYKQVIWDEHHQALEELHLPKPPSLTIRELQQV